VNLPGRSHVEKPFLSVEELQDLADTIDPRHRTLVLTAGYTAARFGELAVNPWPLLCERIRADL
jgi:hypothetical protein